MFDCAESPVGAMRNSRMAGIEPGVVFLCGEGSSAIAVPRA